MHYDKKIGQYKGILSSHGLIIHPLIPGKDPLSDQCESQKLK